MVAAADSSNATSGSCRITSSASNARGSACKSASHTFIAASCGELRGNPLSTVTR
jgi:hypothetical protein